MKIPLLDLRRQYKSMKKEIDVATQKVIDDQDFVLGDAVRGLEIKIAQYCGTKHAVGVASGTDALILALKAMGVGEGDEVITSPFTFFATAEAVSLAGAKPVFVDIDPKTYNIDPSLIEKAITASTKAIIPVHLYGQAADMDPIKKIARKHNLLILEDNAQSIGATYKGNRAGSLGDIASLSFFPSKNLGGFGEGGMVVTNNSSFAEAVRLLRVHGSSKRYIHSVIGTNSRLHNLQAAVLLVKLGHLDKWLDLRRKDAGYYDANLKALPIVLPFVPEYNVHTYYMYVIRASQAQEGLLRHLTDSGIESRVYYPIPLHLQECYKFLGYKEGDLPESEKASRETLALPIFPEMTQIEKDYVISKVKSFFER